MKNLYDEYGELVEQRKVIEERIDQLKAQISPKVSDDTATLTGKEFYIDVIKRISVELDPKKVVKLIPARNFGDVFKAKITEAKKYLNPEQFDKCTAKTMVTFSLQPRRIKNGNST